MAAATGLDRAAHRHRWSLIAAVFILAVADSASSDSDNGEVGQPRPPQVFIDTPGDLSVVDDPSFEVTGVFSGQVNRIEVSIDGGPAVRASAEDDPGHWRLPARFVHLTPGRHRIRAAAFGDGGSSSDAIRVSHRPGGPGFDLLAEPDRLVVNPANPGDATRQVRIETFVADGLSTSLTLTVTSFPAGLNVLPRPDRISAGTGSSLEIDATDAVPGEYVVTVTATSESGDQFQATVAVEVRGEPSRATTTAATAPTTTTPTATGPVEYDVLSEVTASDTGGVANTGEATWQITWSCADARCDASVADGGPRGRIAFDLVYQPTTEAFVFDFVLPTPENQNCPQSLITGEVTPTAWDTTGPVEFAYVLDSKLECATGDLQVSWAGTGSRRGR